MVSQKILNEIEFYLQKVHQAGIEVKMAVLFGSFAQGTAMADSDIDLVVVAPEFDQRTEAQVNLLWELRALADPRIEPIACGSQQWLVDDSSPILSIARDQGIILPFEEMVVI